MWQGLKAVSVFMLPVLVLIGTPVLAADEGAASASPIKISAKASASAPTLQEINQGQFTVNVVIENTSDKDIVIWPYLAMQVLDSDGNPAKKTQNLGRWGRRKAPSILEAIQFVRLKAGETHKIEVNLKKYLHDADVISTWRLSEPGEYDLLLHYDFDRAQIKKKYGDGCKTINNPDELWNQAVEATRKIKVEVVAGT